MADLARFLDAVAVSEIGLTAAEISDAVWLASHMSGFRALMPLAEPGTAEDAGPGPVRAQGDHRGDRKRPADAVTTFTRDWSARTASSTGRGALPVGMAAPRELRWPLSLQRGLRPLLRTIPAGRGEVLDEETTVELSARAAAVVPALHPARERWLDLALVVDTGPSMTLWGGLAGELRQLLAQTGAFRSVRAWYLSSASGKIAITPQAPGGKPHAPKELIDTTGRQAILVVSDCVGQHWWPKSGLALQVIDLWARTGPLAIVQPLPRRMWARSAVQSYNVRLRSAFPGASNRSLLPDPPDQLHSQPQPGVPVPILEIDQRWFASWARLVAGTNPVSVVAALTGPPVPDLDLAARAGPDPRMSEAGQARWLVDQFRSVASPQAFRLAGMLAVAPLRLELMRLIERVFAQGPHPALLAEVLLSGMLQDVTPAGARETMFQFRPHVRDLLLDTIRRSDLIRVRELVYDEISKGRGAGPADYTVLVPSRSQERGTGLTAASEVYGAIDAEVLSRIGGKYAQVVEDSWDVPPSPVRSPLAAGVNGVVMLGGPGSGKTTYLAALGIAFLRQPVWRIIGLDDTSAEAITRLVHEVSSKRAFPQSTTGVHTFDWRIVGEVEKTRKGWMRRPVRRLEKVGMDLRLMDASGEIFTPGKPEDPRRELVDRLAVSRGILFLFDLTREFTEGDTFDYVHRVVTRLAARMLGAGPPRGERLPHHVAVCVSKFDDDRIFRSAGRMGLVTHDPSEPYGFPRVADEDAREFLWRMARLAPAGTAEMALTALETHFQPQRVKYFVSSAIGFHVDRWTHEFDAADPANYIMDEFRPQDTRIRGAIRPINVVEPLIWLGSHMDEGAS
jgi:hypothetical protein